MKPLSEITEPDPRCRVFTVHDQGALRPLTLADHHAMVADIVLPAGVPADVQTLFERARAALLYGWFAYELTPLAEHQACAALPGRTWVIAPDRASLEARWQRLVAEGDPARKEVLFHPHLRGGELGDKHAGKVVHEPLAGQERRTVPVAKDTGAAVPPVRYAFRSFDRQWIIPDNRLLNQPNPTLWESHSARQIYLTALMQHAPTNGPAVSFSALVPDLHHYKGSFSGRAFPLWADAAATTPNVPPGLLALLAEALGAPVAAEDPMAYLAAVAAHPGYIAPLPPTWCSPACASR